MVGLFLFFVGLFSIYLHRRYKHYKKVRDRDSQEEGNDSAANVTPQKNSKDLGKSAKKMSGAASNEKSLDNDMSGSKLFSKLGGAK